jgi:hypothetical protein
MDAPQRGALDIDGTEIPPYGQQEQNACSGHFKSTCYHLGRRSNGSRPAGGWILIPFRRNEKKPRMLPKGS